MSILRLLAPIKEGLSSAPSCAKVTLDLHLPSSGLIYMKPPDDPLWPHSLSCGIPREDQLLSGVLEIRVPSTSFGAGRRCKSVRVGIRTKSRIHMGPKRGWEEDIIFERKVEMLAGNSEGIMLQEGVQHFEFTLILPSTLAPHDWHTNGKVNQELYAEIEGVREPDSSSFHGLSLFGFGRRRSSKSSLTPSRRSSDPSPASSPLTHTTSLSPMLTAAGPLSIARQEEVGMALVPTYEQSQADTDSPSGSIHTHQEDEGEWLCGTIETTRTLMVVHNPNPCGYSNVLNMVHDGILPGIGVWELRIISEVLSIGGPIHLRFKMPSSDPKMTLFAWCLSIRQTHTVTSPRDDPEASKPVNTSRVFRIMEDGVKPEYVRNPGLSHPAVWRGQGAGGNNDGECVIAKTGTLPRDDCGRPTTLPGLITPIKVSHTLSFQMYFSVWGEDDRGNTMAHPGPGGMRYLLISKPLILPSCALIPSLLDLPKYEPCDPNEPCAECGDEPDIIDSVYRSPTPTLSPRSDSLISDTYSAGLSAGMSALRIARPRVKLCAECSVKHDSTEYDMHGWKLCACGLDAEQIVARMERSAATQGAEADRMGAEEREARCRKASIERERRSGSM